MIQETIKKIKIFIIPLLLSAVLIFVPSAEAAVVNPTASVVTQTRAVLTNTYYPGQEGTTLVYGDIVEYTYETDINFVISGLPVDSYVNGYCRITYTPTVDVPTGYNLRGINSYTNPETLSDSFYAFGYRPASNADARLWFYCTFDNYFTHQQVAGALTAHVSFSVTGTYTGSNLTDPPTYITVNNAVTVSQVSMAASQEPDDLGYYHIIKSAFLQALNDATLEVDIDHSDILDELSALYDLLEEYLGLMNANLTSIDDEFQLFFTYIRTALGYQWPGAEFYNLKSQLNYILNSLQNIYDQLTLNNVPAQTQAAAMESNANVVESKMDAVNNYTQPNVNYMLDQADVIWVSGASGQNLLATITNKPYYVMILLGVVSLGFVGYLLYGKGV